jgi:hypothetical protein
MFLGIFKSVSGHEGMREMTSHSRTFFAKGSLLLPWWIPGAFRLA